MNTFAKQKVFYWTNSDVEDLLMCVKARKITAKNCIEQIYNQYGLKHNRVTIHRHAHKLINFKQEFYITDKKFECM